MRFLRRRTARKQRGSITIFFSLGMIPMVGLMALAVELGNVAVHQRRIQNYVDSKAIAALKETFGDVSLGRVEYHDFLDTIEPSGGGIQAVPADGIWDFGATSGDPFRETAPSTLDDRQVPAFRYTVDPFEVPLLFGPIFDVASVDLRAEAVAFAPRREIVIVQDVSASMCLPGSSPCGPNATADTRLAQATDANRFLVTQMISQGIPGDKVGIVEFDSGIERALDLTQLSNDSQTVLDQIDSISSGGNTNIAAGLERGIELFNATSENPEIKRIIILIGDGVGGGNANGTADDARDLGIDVYTILYCGNQGGGSNSACNGAASTYDGLKRLEGTASQPGDLDELQQVMIDIVTGIPMRLVR